MLDVWKIGTVGKYRLCGFVLENMEHTENIENVERMESTEVMENRDFTNMSKILGMYSE